MFSSFFFFSPFFFSFFQDDTSPEAFVKEVFPRSSAVQHIEETKTLGLQGAANFFFSKIGPMFGGCKSLSGSIAKKCYKNAFQTLDGICKGENGVCMQELARQKKVLLKAYSKMTAVVMVTSSSFGLPIGHKATTLLWRTMFKDAIAFPLSLGGKPSFFVLVSFFALAFVAALILLVAAVKCGFWAEKKPFLALLVVVEVGSSFALCYWTLVSTGSQVFGRDPEVANVQSHIVEILGRISSVMFLLLFALFTWILISAIFESFFPEKRNLSFTAAAILGLLALGTSAYAITMAVVHSQIQNSLTVDASGPLLAGISFLFSAVLALLWFSAWRLVVTKKTNDANFTEMRRNAFMFFACSSLLAAVFLVSFVVSLLELTVDYFKYNDAATGLSIASTILTVLAVLGYTGAAVVGAARSQSKSKEAKGEGYVPLKEPDQVPARYKDF